MAAWEFVKDVEDSESKKLNLPKNEGSDYYICAVNAEGEYEYLVAKFYTHFHHFVDTANGGKKNTIEERPIFISGKRAFGIDKVISWFKLPGHFKTKVGAINGRD